MDAPGVVEHVAEETPPPGSVESDVLSIVTFDRGASPQSEVLAFVQSHGSSMAWQADR
jgi:hypothetical protein